MKIRLLLLVGVGMLFGPIAPLAVADDLNPPPYRGAPLSTLTEWEFLTPANPAVPDGAIIPVVGDGGGGGPLATISGPMLWDAFDGDGAWIGNGQPGQEGQIALDIPNWIDELPTKHIRVQMVVQQFTSSSGLIVTPYVSAVDAFDPTGPTVASLVNVSEFVSDPLNGLVHRTEDWILHPNPDYERIFINVPSDTLVDQIVVDTISVPEPSTVALALLGIASFVAIARRR